MARWRALAAASCGIIAATASLMGSQAAWAATSPPIPQTASAWSVSGNTHNCPAAMRLLVPTKSAGYFASHPAALQPDQGASVKGALGRALGKMAAARIHWVTSLSCRRGHAAPRHPQAPSATFFSGNWSGYQASSDPGYQGGGGASFLGVTASWTLPAIFAPFATTSLYSTIWPGIGTGNSSSDSLIQDGSEQDVLCSGSNCTQNYDFWTEVVPQDPFENVITSMTASPGDQVEAIAEVDPTSALAFFDVVDFTTGQGFSTLESVPGEVGASTAEWIVERPTINGTTLPNLADFSTVDLQSDQVAYGQNWSDPNLDEPFIGSLNPEDIIMTTCNGSETMAFPDAITNGTDFTDEWNSTGTVDPAGCA